MKILINLFMACLLFVCQSLNSKLSNAAIDIKQVKVFKIKASKHQHVNNFFKTLGVKIYDKTKTTAVPPSIAIAQCALESGWGKTVKAPFGIKGKGPAGFHLLLAEEWEDGKKVKRFYKFRKYNSIDESIDDYIDLIERKYMGEDFDGILENLTGYSTCDQYTKRLKYIINKYELENLDLI